MSEPKKADRERAKKFFESITDQPTSPSYGDCSYEHIKPGSDDALADEFSALRKEEHDSSREREKTMAEALGRFVVFLSFLEAHQECANLKPLEDSDVVVSFMGSGASDSITVGDFRMAREALKALRTK